MKTIADRGRKILSRFFRVISVSAASLILQACYGMMLPDEPSGAYGMPAPAYGMPSSTSISGKVISNEDEEPIPAIQVSIEGTEYWEYTNKYGRFDFWGVPIKDVYIIKIEDVDGPAHGQFKTQTLTITKDDVPNLQPIRMEVAE